MLILVKCCISINNIVIKIYVLFLFVCKNKLCTFLCDLIKKMCVVWKKKWHICHVSQKINFWEFKKIKKKCWGKKKNCHILYALLNQIFNFNNYFKYLLSYRKMFTVNIYATPCHWFTKKSLSQTATTLSKYPLKLL